VSGTLAERPRGIVLVDRLPEGPQMTFPRLITDLPEFDGPFDAYRLAAEGCDVLFASYPSGTVIDDHSHETDNVGVIVSGELVLTVDGQQARYGPGDWYEVPRGTTHSARFDTATAEIELWFAG
jgi:mannose-6-phosphate isomerase-like protein (cupin superfamily)